MQVKTQKRAPRCEATLPISLLGKRQELVWQELGKRQEGKRDALDKKPNIRYFYKYEMLPN
jgi:hypothetical protein